MFYFAFLAVLLPLATHAIPKEKPCPVVCPFLYQPVCGNDGKTYSNKCAVKAERECKGKKDLEIANYGECGTNKKKGTDCSSKYETGMCRAYFRRWYFDLETNGCKSFAYGGCGGNDNNYHSKEDCEDKCLNPCPEMCPNLHKPVCASDGKTYDNECQLQVAIGCWKEGISFMYTGECKGPK